LLDVESGRTLLNQIILVAGGRTQAVGTGFEVPDGAQVIDETTKYAFISKRQQG
jgi:hypothetical protein